MTAVHRFSEQVIDYAERLSDVADAAQGKQRRAGAAMSRWVLLPVSGAAAYALLKSEFVSRRAKDVMDDARTRALELPDDLMGRVREVTDGAAKQKGSRRRGSTARSRTGSKKTSSASRRTPTSSAR